MELIARAAAKERGLPRYFTGKPCKNGHVSIRRTDNGVCHGCNVVGMRVYRLNNLDARREAARRYQKENPHVEAARVAKRRAEKLRATPSWADMGAVAGFYEDARWFTKVTGVQHHVDHIVPLKGANVCGLHVPWNLEVILATDNLRKNNKWQSA